MAAEGAPPAGAAARRADLVYVSWGGTGRAASLRAALARAADAGRGLVYLAILDQSTFADVDPATIELAKDELAWLLDAQLALAKDQAGADGLDVRVVVRAGDVADAIADVVEVVGGGRGGTEVLIGAPVPVAGHDSVTELIELLGRRVGAPVHLVEPEPAIGGGIEGPEGTAPGPVVS